MMNKGKLSLLLALALSLFMVLGAFSTAVALDEDQKILYRADEIKTAMDTFKNTGIKDEILDDVSVASFDGYSNPQNSPGEN